MTAADPQPHDVSATDRLLRLGGPGLLRRMAELFRENAPGRIAALREGAASGDAERVARAAHSLKSTAPNVGGAALAATARALEEAVATGDAERAARLGADAERQLAALLEWLDARVAESGS
jgi:HPt (histidine-containing phosphotransfer) domain-containing protein